MDKKDIINKFPILYKLYTKYKIIVLNKYWSRMNKNTYPIKLAKLYYKKTNRILDWNNLITYNEKMQWAKLYDIDDRKTSLTDKLLVREYIKETIGEQYLIPLLGVWNSFEDIEFNKLPNEFVLKTNHGSGTNLIVRDKKNLCFKEAKLNFDNWLKTNFAFKNGFEMQYFKIQPKIIAEKYIESDNNNLMDYKFLCFDGKVHYCWVDSERHSDHRRNIYNLDWELQNWQQNYLKNTDYPIKKPINLS